MEWWQVLLNHVLELSIAILVPVALHLLNRWLKQRELEFLSEVVEKAVTGGVAFAEEQAHKALKADGKKTPSAEKLDIALNFVEGRLKDAGYDKLARDKLIELIEAKLNQVRSEQLQAPKRE